ncbi:hypothetical protein KAR91_75265 [Candidatus Pacearchaeota archaeon]|nr:hypothetical protein [Candidatus Pacearchaeota archaeon]
MIHVKREDTIGPYWRSYEPFLDENSSNLQGKPTLITRGIFKGYSMPIGGIGEELSFRIRVPFRWDGVTKPWFVAISSTLTAGEGVGDKYKFQLEWSSTDVGYTIPDTVIETLTDEITVLDPSSFFSTIIAFEVCADCLVSGQNMQGKLTRIAASEPQVSNEIAVWHWCTRWKMDRLGTDSIQGYGG